MTRPGQAVDCLAADATMTPRRVFAYDGVGYTRDAGPTVPAYRPTVAAPVAKAERFPILALAAVGFALGTVLAVAAVFAGVI